MTSPSLQTLWSAILAKVAGQVGQHSFETWFKPLTCAGADATSLHLFAPNETFGRCLLDSFGDLLRQSVADIRGAPCQLLITTPTTEIGSPRIFSKKSGKHYRTTWRLGSKGI